MPLLDFVDLDDCEPTIVSTPGVSSVTVRTLNREPVSGAVAAVVDSPAGVTVPAGHWSGDVEVLVLDGDLTLGEELVERYGYLFVPAGVRLPAVTVGRDGVRLLVFTSRTLEHSPSGEDVPGAARHRMVGPVHAADVPWERPRVEGFPAGAARKTLRDDPEAGQGFWLLGVLPHWDSPYLEWHTFNEENYILEGEIETAVGLMRPGSYLSHPAGERYIHGPMRSRRGAFLLTRASGPLGNTYLPTDQQLPGLWR